MAVGVSQIIVFSFMIVETCALRTFYYRVLEHLSLIILAGNIENKNRQHCYRRNEIAYQLHSLTFYLITQAKVSIIHKTAQYRNHSICFENDSYI